jgi:hypothetical protein
MPNENRTAAGQKARVATQCKLDVEDRLASIPPASDQE